MFAVQVSDPARGRGGYKDDALDTPAPFCTTAGNETFVIFVLISQLLPKSS